MQSRVRRWFLVVSVVAVGAVGALTAGPAGAGRTPNCVVERQIVPVAQQVPVPERCAELEVTKVVTGQAAPGTTFDVVVDCEAPEQNGVASEQGVGAQQDLPEGRVATFTETLVFDEEGGTQSIFIGEPGGVCTVSEEPPAGCEVESIEPEVTDVDDDEVFPVTVTNSCAVAPTTTTAPPAPAAAPAAAEPRFTG